jgi:hypothetical protein
MQHSLIAWDASFRDFFHLIDGALAQEYDTSEYELIYVEQRSKEFANEYAAAEGVASLEDRYEEVKDDLDITIEYIGDDTSRPYHIGRCVNRGLELAEGEIVSVMDGDQILPPDFLDVLDEFHDGRDAIANVIRRNAAHPVDVDERNWKQATIDYEGVLEACPDRGDPIPSDTPNYGPLISARAEHWEEINGYDPHRIWSTGVSLVGSDANKRLENHVGRESELLEDAVTAHPWHPIGFDRGVFRNKKMFYLHDKLVDYAVEHGVEDWSERVEFTRSLYEDHRMFVEKTVTMRDLAVPGSAEYSEPSAIDKGIAELSRIAALWLYDEKKKAISTVKNDISEVTSALK